MMYAKLLIIIFYISLDHSVSSRYLLPIDESDSTLSLTPVPWLGVLKYRRYRNGTRVATTVVLIRNKIAITNAEGIAKLNALGWDRIRRRTKVIFLLADRTTWFARVLSSKLHPEFNEETLSTLALLHLETDFDIRQRDLLKWPSKVGDLAYVPDRIFAFGYTDRNRQLEQKVYRMEYVSYNNCLEFYAAEKIDTRWRRPKKYNCYTIRYASEPCIFDAGLALMYHSKQHGILLGISTWGPGCALPTRFLDFEYFLPWIVEQTATRRQSVVITPDPIWMAETIPPVLDLDTWMLSQVTNSSYILKPFTEKVEDLGGTNCTENTKSWHKLLYRDREHYTFADKSIEAIAVYGLSMYDLRRNGTNYTCIQVISNTHNRSSSTLWYTKSFEQDHELMPYIKQIEPYGAIQKPSDKQITYYLYESNVLYHYDIIGTDVTHLIFRFNFKLDATFEVFFYGIPDPDEEEGGGGSEEKDPNKKVGGARSSLSETDEYTRKPIYFPSFFVEKITNRTRRIYTTSTILRPPVPVATQTPTTQRTRVSRSTTKSPVIDSSSESESENENVQQKQSTKKTGPSNWWDNWYKPRPPQNM